MEPRVSAQGISVLHHPANPTTDIVFVHGFTGHPKSTWTLERSKVRKRERDEAPLPRSKLLRFGRKKAPRQDSAQQSGPGEQSKSSETQVPSFSSENSHGIGTPSGDSSAGGEQGDVYWPYHLLPPVVPSARVLTYGYDTQIRHLAQAPISKNSMHDHAWELLCTLEAKRRAPEEKRRPLLLVAHSLGGLVVKEMLKRARESGIIPGRSYLHDIFLSTTGVMFFGTPHRGADPRAFLHHVLSISLQGLGFKVNKDIVEGLMPRAGRQPDAAAFAEMACEQKWIVYSFQEEYGMPMLFGKKVVDDQSSCLDLPFVETVQHIGSNHMDMCRFHAANDAGYQKVVAALQRIIGTGEPLRSHEDNGLPPQAPMSTEVEKLPNEGSGQVFEAGEDVAHMDVVSPTDNDAPFPENSLTSEQRKRLQDLLWFDQIDARLMTIRTAHFKTCQWFLSTPEAIHWLDVDKMSDHGGLLWIKGKPGAGKSIMMKYLFSHAQKHASGKRSETPIVVSFFFNARGEMIEKSTLGCYRSILLQLLEKAPELQSAMDHLTGSGFRYVDKHGWNIESLTQTLIEAVGLLKRPVKCFIDALDECDEAEVREMVGFLERLGEMALTTGAQGRLHLCFSSRHYPSIVPKKGLQVMLEDRAEHHDDIACYVESELRLGNSLQTEEIKAMILSRCSNIFLWVVLVIPILNREYANGRMTGLRKRLDSIPPGLDDLFDMILTRDDENIDELRVCIQFILFSVTPLTPQALSVAVQLGLDQGFNTEVSSRQMSMADHRRYVDSSSKGLAEVTRSSRPTVQFIHESVRDFLLGKGGRRNRWSGFGDALNSGVAHNFLKECCFAQLRPGFIAHFQDREFTDTQDEVTKVPKPKKGKYPFLEYAVTSVLEHADHAQGEGVCQDDFIKEFPMSGWVLLHNMFEAYQTRRHSTDVYPLYIFADRNLAHLIRSYPMASLHFSLRGGRYGYPILAAIALRHGEALSALIAAVGLDIDIKTSSQLLGQLSLDRSFKFGEEQMGLAAYLVVMDFVPLVQKYLGSYAGQRLSELVHEKHGSSSRTLLFWARSKAMADLLISYGADPNARDCFSNTPLLYAIKVGRLELVEYFCAHAHTIGFNPNVQDLGGRTGLQIICKQFPGGDPDDLAISMTRALNRKPGDLAISMTRALLKTPGIDVNIQDSQGKSALHSALDSTITNPSWDVGEELVRLLLSDPNVDVNLQDNMGRTALHLVCAGATNEGYYGGTDGRPNEEIVRLLLSDPNIDINLQDNTGRTALGPTYAYLGI
ncbi:hypothetical protein QBC47DRAFT_153287 [Echria macrotheca]|uniref:Nephrocystin 3-like N-terminal domain-containing protein n=1 Tax=Echria macrotheca TaxID=438768 RepID=A0AAJ0B0A9_9PEZI|nr:hypothetical protein QBC47DRAFT_153287 [Echria macrotheca]